MAVIEMENKSIRTDYHDLFDLFGENVLVKLGRTQHIGSNFLKHFFWNAFGITGFDAVLTFGLADPNVIDLSGSVPFSASAIMLAAASTGYLCGKGS